MRFMTSQSLSKMGGDEADVNVSGSYRHNMENAGITSMNLDRSLLIWKQSYPIYIFLLPLYYCLIYLSAAAHHAEVSAALRQSVPDSLGQ